MGRMRLKNGDRKRAVVMLRRLVMNEVGEINITDGGKTLGLRDLSKGLADDIWEQMFFKAHSPTSKAELAQLVEKRIIEYFTAPTPLASTHPASDEHPHD